MGYGAIAYFNSAMKLTHINCSHCGGANKSLIVAPGDELWQHAKWVFRVSMLVTCTIKDHLVGVHLMYSNYMSVALREELPLAHPMRPLIFIHTYGTTTVNRAAVFSLCVEHGLLHRASSLTWPGTEAAFKLSFEIKNRRFADMRDITKEAGTLGLNEQVYPYGTDLRAYYDVVETYVAGYVDAYYSSDADIRADMFLQRFWQNLRRQSKDRLISTRLDGKEQLVKALTNGIVAITSFHNHMGNVAEYLVNPTYSGGKITLRSTMSDMQASFQGLNIALTTAVPMPKLMGDFTHLLHRDDKLPRTQEVFGRFQEDLKRLADRIDARNAVSDRVCNSFNPRFLLCSVSI